MRGAAATAALLALCAAPSFAADASRAACASLATEQIPDTIVKPTYITTVEDFETVVKMPDTMRAIFEGSVSGAKPALPFCRVELTITPAPGAEIRSELWLPGAERWNRKYLAMGAIGAAGTLDRGSLTTGIAKGYAIATSDAGSHSGGAFKMAFGRNPELAANRAYRGVHLTAVAAKQLVLDYYGEKQAAAIFMGCSGGGYEGMSLIQRYPEDYDGVLVGDPALDWEKLGLWQGWVYKVSHREPGAAIPKAKLPFLHQSMISACDARDGLTDGVLDDPRRCKIDLKKLQCKGAEGDACFTPAQVKTLEMIYAPFRHPRTKEMLYPAFNPSAESGIGATARLSNESFGSTITAAQPGPLVWSLPEAFKAEDWLTFDFDKGTDAAIKAFAPYANSNPDLSAFKARGGKVIMFTGWSDPNLHPEVLISYYDAMGKAVGGTEAARSFSRLFMAPGLNHCIGGDGPNVFGQQLVTTAPEGAERNILQALERWVLEGVAPEQIIAQRHVDDDRSKPVARTRPLCAYPKVARWTGKGSSDAAENFSCVDPPK